ncbi:aspartate aminotransferase family protein [Conexivisphaera calida]|uniref:N-acetyl-lysine aminotransferase n=1 Tax=Conexivisphaera calida TaxID=1874277 RepID=A0A4P2VCW7_9ARCH|nr:aspartate aminotransferase family protein [Conexivisphaera calida]BBE41662.1 N-acetyl-lysine aminotransferase [Conexivisphaera calida]
MDPSHVIEVEDSKLLRTFQRFGLVVDHALGAYIWDASGRAYLDFMAGYGVAILGHGRREIADAIKAQLDRNSICHGSLYSPARAEFLEELFSVLPSNMSSAYMANSGAEAIEAAIKVAVKATGRSLLMAAKGSYHGKTLGALSITWGEKYRKPFSQLLPKVHFVDYGDLKSLESAPFEEAAALFLEPVQGEGGVNIPSGEFMREAERRCRSSGCVLVMDEIQAGLGRTGRIWAHEHWGVRPDVMTIGKGIGGGVPMGITAMSSELSSAMRLGEQTSTFGGNPLASAAGTAVLRVLKAERLWENAEKMGSRFIQGLGRIASSRRLAESSRGLGLMDALDLRIGVSEVIPALISNGFISTYSGLRTLRFLPPITIGEEEVDRALSIIDKTLAEIEQAKRAASGERD